MDEDGCTALHLAVALGDRGRFTIPPNNSPELSKVSVCTYSRTSTSVYSRTSTSVYSRTSTM